MRTICTFLIALAIPVTTGAFDYPVVFFFGDSVTAGPYPHYTKGVTKGYKYMVFARRNARTAEVQKIMKVIMSLHTLPRPTHIVVYAGINDCAPGKIEYADRAIKNLWGMIDFADELAIIDLIIMKVHTRNDCAAKINRWLDTVPREKARVISADVGPAIHPGKKDAIKMAVAVSEAIMEP